MKTYNCKGFRPIKTDSASDAGHVFAERLARRLHGKAGRVVAFRCDSWTPDGRLHCFEAFIGYRSGERGAETTGKNVWFNVYRA